jgi:hypothetical protein
VQVLKVEVVELSNLALSKAFAVGTFQSLILKLDALLFA